MEFAAAPESPKADEGNSPLVAPESAPSAAYDGCDLLVVRSLPPFTAEQCVSVGTVTSLAELVDFVTPCAGASPGPALPPRFLVVARTPADFLFAATRTTLPCALDTARTPETDAALLTPAAATALASQAGNWAELLTVPGFLAFALEAIAMPDLRVQQVVLQFGRLVGREERARVARRRLQAAYNDLVLLLFRALPGTLEAEFAECEARHAQRLAVFRRLDPNGVTLDAPVVLLSALNSAVCAWKPMWFTDTRDAAVRFRQNTAIQRLCEVMRTVQRGKRAPGRRPTTGLVFPHAIMQSHLRQQLRCVTPEAYWPPVLRALLVVAVEAGAPPVVQQQLLSACQQIFVSLALPSASRPAQEWRVLHGVAAVHLLMRPVTVPLLRILPSVQPSGIPGSDWDDESSVADTDASYSLDGSSSEDDDEEEDDGDDASEEGSEGESEDDEPPRATSKRPRPAQSECTPDEAAAQRPRVAAPPSPAVSGESPPPSPGGAALVHASAADAAPLGGAADSHVP
jgi:hypothetical protein